MTAKMTVSDYKLDAIALLRARASDEFAVMLGVVDRTYADPRDLKSLLFTMTGMAQALLGHVAGSTGRTEDDMLDALRNNVLAASK